MKRLVHIDNVSPDEWFYWVDIYASSDVPRRAVVLCGNPMEASKLFAAWYETMYGVPVSEMTGQVIFSSKEVENYSSDCTFLISSDCETEGDFRHTISGFCT